MATDHSPCPAVRTHRFKRLSLLLLSGLLASTAAYAEPPSEKYGCRAPAPGSVATEKGASCMPVGRSGDSFVFCTEGMPQHGWVSVDPLAGVWIPIWWDYDSTWVSAFEQICPRARQMGNWQGATPPSMTPFMH